MITSGIVEKCKEFKAHLDDGLTITPTYEDMKTLLPLLGANDSSTREELAVQTLSHILKQRDTPTSLRQDIIEELLSDHYLSFHLGAEGADHAVKRSFSALVIADAIEGDRIHEAALDAQTLARYSGELRRYLSLENDRRSYDPRLGRMDCMAHVSACFTALAQHPEIRLSSLSENFLSILDFIEREGDAVFHSQEEQWFGKALAVTLLRLDESFIHKFLLPRFTKDFLIGHPSKQNFKNTFRAAYLEILWFGDPQIPILETLKNLILCNL